MMFELLPWMDYVFLFAVAIPSFLFLRLRCTSRARRIVAFFHPHAIGRGGGERVLWSAVGGISDRPEVERIVIYSLETDRGELFRSRNETFKMQNRDNDSKIVFRKLRFPFLLEPKTFPIATIFGQSIGSMIVLISGLVATPLNEWPDVFIDSTGCPFTLPVARILTGASACAYIHYPTMSNDMIGKVTSRKSDFNNRTIFTSNRLLLAIKTLYYRVFLLSYRICGWFVKVAVGNSNWTVNRLQAVWKRSDIEVLYPPAAIGDGEHITVIAAQEDKVRLNAIVSVAQFRPEKNHELQLRVFARVLKSLPDTKLWVMGGCRNKEDESLISRLRRVAAEDLRIPESQIEFIVNAPREEVDKRLRTAKCAIHTMVDEHFGISLLEYLAAKTPIVTHRSGGPELDILLPNEEYGYLANSEDEYVRKIENVLKNFDSAEVRQKRINGFNSLTRFLSDEMFGDKFASIFLSQC
jgi:alpha-1,2-mannosyltransferase